MDVKYVKRLINSHKHQNKKIQYGDYIDKDLFKMLIKLIEIDRESCFAPTEFSPPIIMDYSVEMKCPQCRKYYIRKENKTSLFTIMVELHCGHNKYLCNDCQKIKDKEKAEIEREECKKYEERLSKIRKQGAINKLSETQKYIKNYLTIGTKWKNGVKINDKADNIIREAKCLNSDEIAEQIKDMNYQDFLSTPYWSGISLYAKKKAGFKCALCGSGGNLNTHHKTYDRHGYEHTQKVIDEDLIVLCHDCHKKFHDIADSRLT